MNLSELQAAVNEAVELAEQNGESPGEVPVTLQIERGETVWSADEVELHYDGNLDASGCVLTALAKPLKDKA